MKQPRAVTDNVKGIRLNYMKVLQRLGTFVYAGE